MTTRGSLVGGEVYRCVDHDVDDGGALLGQGVPHGRLDLLGFGHIVALSAKSFDQLLIACCSQPKE